MHTLERRTPHTTGTMLAVSDKIQQALHVAQIRLEDFCGRDAIPRLQEAGEHALTLHAMIAAKVKELDAARAV